MVEEKLLTIKDASLILGISEKEVVDLAESGKIPAYKVGGIYLRFKQQQIEAFKETFRRQKLSPQRLQEKESFKDKVSDFFYFNDFYIISILIILLILVVLFKGY